MQDEASRSFNFSRSRTLFCVRHAFSLSSQKRRPSSSTRTRELVEYRPATALNVVTVFIGLPFPGVLVLMGCNALEGETEQWVPGAPRHPYSSFHNLLLVRVLRVPWVNAAHVVPRGGRPTPAQYNTDSVIPSMPRSCSTNVSASPMTQ